MSLLDLAERVEAAKGGNYDLGVEIATACDMETPWGNPLASLDAAMSLVDMPFDHIEAIPPRGDYTGWTVHIIPPSRGLSNLWTGYAPTYEAALTAASLRARHALAKEVG